MDDTFILVVYESGYCPYHQHALALIASLDPVPTATVPFLPLPTHDEGVHGSDKLGLLLLLEYHLSLSHTHTHSLTHTEHLFFLILVGDALIVTAELFVGRCEEPT